MKYFFNFCALVFMSASIHAVNAEDCVVNIEAGDSLSYNMQSITIAKNCATAKINFKHTGNLGANIMGHNWVLAESADLSGIQGDGNVAGMQGGYLKKGDSRVLAATDVIGGGESTSVTFDTSVLQSGQDYSFFCTVMSHSVVMKGAFVVSG